VVYTLRLRLGGKEVEAQASVPTGSVRVADLLPIVHSLTNAVVDAAAANEEAQGRRITCRAGCGACCRQVVPIAEAEAVLLAELVSAMKAEDQSAIRARFEQAVDRLRDAGLLDAIRMIAGMEDGEARHRLGLEYFRLGLACPFLEEEACGIHPLRPLSCREYLVTSPAPCCGEPDLKRVTRVVVPVRPSKVLYRFGDGEGKDAPRWLPLLLALEWAAQHPDTAARTFAGPKLFENLLAQLTAGPATPCAQ
jgi:Fe-S-cluster containining protein